LRQFPSLIQEARSSARRRRKVTGKEEIKSNQSDGCIAVILREDDGESCHQFIALQGRQGNWPALRVTPAPHPPSLRRDMRRMDMGAIGLVMLQVETEDQARLIVRCARYFSRDIMARP
jgi:hypothetical protein